MRVISPIPTTDIGISILFYKTYLLLFQGSTICHGILLSNILKQHCVCHGYPVILYCCYDCYLNHFLLFGCILLYLYYVSKVTYLLYFFLFRSSIKYLNKRNAPKKCMTLFKNCSTPYMHATLLQRILSRSVGVPLRISDTATCVQKGSVVFFVHCRKARNFARFHNTRM